MSFLDPERLEHEISRSLELLREKAGVFPKHYSYPEGLQHCYSSAVILALKKQGVVSSATAISGLNTFSDSPFHLKRIMVA